MKDIDDMFDKWQDFTLSPTEMNLEKFNEASTRAFGHTQEYTQQFQRLAEVVATREEAREAFENARAVLGYNYDPTVTLDTRSLVVQVQ